MLHHTESKGYTMKIVKLNQDWGAAHEIASPYKVIHQEVEFTFYIRECGDVRIELPTDAEVSWSKAGLTANIPN